MNLTPPQKLSMGVLVVLLVILFGFDSWTLAVRGYETTMSWTLYTVAKDWPVIPFAFGFFAGHLFFANRAARKCDAL